MADKKITCGENFGPFGETLNSLVTVRGGNQADTEQAAITEVEQKCQQAQHALLMSCPNQCPQAANIKGEKPIKGKVVISKPIFERRNLKGTTITIPAFWIFGGISLKIDRDLWINEEVGWESVAVASWHIDSFECTSTGY